MTADKLPPLPVAEKMGTDVDSVMRPIQRHGYTADQMREYALAAITHSSAAHGAKDQARKRRPSQVNAWADMYESEGGHAIIVAMLREYFTMLRIARGLEPPSNSAALVGVCKHCGDTGVFHDPHAGPISCDLQHSPMVQAALDLHSFLLEQGVAFGYVREAVEVVAKALTAAEAPALAAVAAPAGESMRAGSGEREVPQVLRDALVEAVRYSPKSFAGSDAIHRFQVLAGDYVQRLIDESPTTKPAAPSGAERVKPLWRGFRHEFDDGESECFDHNDEGCEKCERVVLIRESDFSTLTRPESTAGGGGEVEARQAIRLLVAAGHVSEDAANQALRIAHGFERGSTTAPPAQSEYVMVPRALIPAARIAAYRLSLLCDTRLRGQECAEVRSELHQLQDALAAATQEGSDE